LTEGGILGSKRLNTGHDQEQIIGGRSPKATTNKPEQTPAKKVEAEPKKITQANLDKGFEKMSEKQSPPAKPVSKANISHLMGLLGGKKNQPSGGSKCNHGPNGKCLNCMDNDPTPKGNDPTPKENEMITEKPQASDIIPEKTKPASKNLLNAILGRKPNPDPSGPKCDHGPKGKCIQCISPSDPPAPELPAGMSRRTKLCKHPDHGLCMHCMDTSAQSQVKPKCDHGPNGKCIHCLSEEEVIQETKPAPPEELLQDLLQQHVTGKKCTHGPRAKCMHCIDGHPSDAKHKSFDLWLRTLQANCKNHDQNSRCNNCIMNFEVSYKKQLNCAKHPKNATCTTCLPPTVTCTPQPYRHVDFCSFFNFEEINGF
jgi:hypothetical protein